MCAHADVRAETIPAGNGTRGAERERSGRRNRRSARTGACLGLLDELIEVLGGVDQAASVQLHLVRRDHAGRHVLVAVLERDDLALLPPIPRVALNLVADAKAERLDLLLLELLALGARGESGLELVVVEVLADEDQLPRRRRTRGSARAGQHGHGERRKKEPNGRVWRHRE